MWIRADPPGTPPPADPPKGQGVRQVNVNIKAQPTFEEVIAKQGLDALQLIETKLLALQRSNEMLAAENDRLRAALTEKQEQYDALQALCMSASK
jgi:hypothetical protein